MEDKIKDIVSFIVEKEKEVEESIESAKNYWSFWVRDEVFRWEEEEKKIREDFEKFLDELIKEKRLEIKKKEALLEEEYQRQKEEYKRRLEENYHKALEFLWKKFGE
ncbi:MAG: hypothetical protein N2312_05210 [Dictyoglomaceae bacterium]|nr:hypothetical protein [Dictyoglomaceae bacterium]